MNKLFKGPSFLMKYFVLLFFCVFPCLTWAAAATCTGNPNGLDAFAVGQTMVQCITTGIPTDVFLEKGQMLLGTLTAMSVVWLGIKSMLEGAAINEVIANLVVAVLTWGFASFLMMPSTLTPIDSGFDTMTQMAIDKAGSKSGNSQTIVANVLGSSVFAAISMFTAQDQSKLVNDSNKDTNPQSSTAVPVVGGSDGSVEAVTSGEKKIQDSAPRSVSQTFDSLASLTNPLVWQGFVFRVLTSILIMISALAFAAVYVYAQVSFKIGICLAPIMTPWLVLKQTDFLFHGWARLMVTAGLQKVISGVLIASLFSTVQWANGLANTTTGTVANYTVWAMLFIIYAVMAYIFMQVPQIAGHLSGGGHGLSTALVNKLSPGGAVKAAAAAVQKTATVAASAVTGGASGAAAAGAEGASKMGKFMGAVKGAAAGAQQGMGGGLLKAAQVGGAAGRSKSFAQFIGGGAQAGAKQGAGAKTESKPSGNPTGGDPFAGKQSKAPFPTLNK